MAKLFFVGLDGAEKSYRLQTHRPFTVGRDPGNDIILRDPKVSRHHAEIVFERGFFVLHDLASANGTFVNGKRIRVAPLTHAAKLRLGNSYGRFSEELPTEEGGEPLQALEPFDQSMPSPPPTEDVGDLVPTSAHERLNHDLNMDVNMDVNMDLNMNTLPHEQFSVDDIKKN